MRHGLWAKGAALAAVLLGLMWALSSVTGVVRERQGRLEEVRRGVARSLAEGQTLAGPLLRRQCAEVWNVQVGEGSRSRMVQERHEFVVQALPDSLLVNGSTALEARYRGVFKINGYRLAGSLDAQWADLAALRPAPRHDGGQVSCGAPVLLVALGDARGIRHVSLSIRGQVWPLQPGTGHAGHAQGVHAVLPPELIGGGALRASLKLELVGTGHLAFAPVATDTRVMLASNWPHPSFGGRFLPTERRITARGFEAEWQISALATTARDAMLGGGGACWYGSHAEAGDDSGYAAQAAPAQASTGGEADRPACVESFGVSFIDPVNPYVLSDRATKYGLLFIALTFVGVGLVEVMRRLRVHPIQYLLVGSALVVFFLLLVSLSEYLAFGWAYTAASASCTALLGYYGAHVLRGWRAGLAMGAGMAVLYGALYLLLQLEQGSLVIGSVLLFTTLALVMVVTRRLDWYELLPQLRGETGTPAPAPAQGTWPGEEKPA